MRKGHSLDHSHIVSVQFKPGFACMNTSAYGQDAFISVSHDTTAGWLVSAGTPHGAVLGQEAADVAAAEAVGHGERCVTLAHLAGVHVHALVQQQLHHPDGVVLHGRKQRGAAGDERPDVDGRARVEQESEGGAKVCTGYSGTRMRA